MDPVSTPETTTPAAPEKPVEPQAQELQSTLGKRDAPGALDPVSAGPEALKVIDSIFGSNAPAADKQVAADFISRSTEALLDLSEKLKRFEQMELEQKLVTLRDQLHAMRHPDPDGILKKSSEDPTYLAFALSFSGVGAPQASSSSSSSSSSSPPAPAVAAPEAKTDPTPAQTAYDMAARQRLQERIDRYNQLTRAPAYAPSYNPPYSGNGLSAQVSNAFGGSRQVSVAASSQSSLTPMQQLARELVSRGQRSYTPSQLVVIGEN